MRSRRRLLGTAEEENAGAEAVDRVAEGERLLHL
jgi:hypothetical protein